MGIESPQAARMVAVKVEFLKNENINGDILIRNREVYMDKVTSTFCKKQSRIIHTTAQIV